MKSPIFGKEKLLYFPQKSGIVPIFKKSPSSYISYFCHHAPCYIQVLAIFLNCHYPIALYWFHFLCMINFADKFSFLSSQKMMQIHHPASLDDMTNHYQACLLIQKFFWHFSMAIHYFTN